MREWSWGKAFGMAMANMAISSLTGTQVWLLHIWVMSIWADLVFVVTSCLAGWATYAAGRIHWGIGTLVGLVTVTAGYFVSAITIDLWLAPFVLAFGWIGIIYASLTPAIVGHVRARRIDVPEALPSLPAISE